MTENNTYQKITLSLILVSSLLLGASILLMGHHGHIKLITDFYGISEVLSPSIANAIAGIFYLVVAALMLAILLGKPLEKISGIIITLGSIVPLLALAGKSMWIDSLGGFPAIGSGQGVIKYFALLSLGILLISDQFSRCFKKVIVLFPIALVLIWIGGMKFTLLEAKGIQALVETSPLMSWMYSIWDLQTTSNLIGVYDLIAVVLLIASLKFKPLLLPAIVMSGAVFVVTQTFLFSWPSALSAETLLTTGGHFLIKDLWYIACSIIFYQSVKPLNSVTE